MKKSKKKFIGNKIYLSLVNKKNLSKITKSGLMIKKNQNLWNIDLII